MKMYVTMYGKGRGNMFSCNVTLLKARGIFKR